MDGKAHAENVLKIVAKIIAPAIEPNFNLGYTWCIEQTKSSAYNDLANDLEIDKALMYLKQRDFHQVNPGNDAYRLHICLTNLKDEKLFYPDG
ncbi:unnamed protein product [Dibothriocephalus latus]|uniref:Uncharacterized protein n=1 Tax=Dibothriocephalus latus TaxID=60516 RepID=A0A3P7LI27_DIBLA|nr:unnamed protein product [Dibothriocephalus latus]